MMHATARTAAAPLIPLFRLLTSVLLLVATEGVMQLDQCELCEIALNEGHHFMVRMMEANKGKQIRLEKEFDALRTDYSTWSQYNPFYKSAMDMFYLSEDKKDTHFRSIMWKFHSVYGAKDFSKEDLAKGHHFGGAVDAANVYGMWKKECVDISGFCKKSDLRVPAFKLNQCGIAGTWFGRLPSVYDDEARPRGRCPSALSRMWWSLHASRSSCGTKGSRPRRCSNCAMSSWMNSTTL